MKVRRAFCSIDLSSSYIFSRVGGVEVALGIAGKLYDWLKLDPNYLLDFGVLQVTRRGP